MIFYYTSVIGHPQNTAISQILDMESVVNFCNKLTDNRVFQDLLDDEFTASNDSLSENTTTKVSLAA